MNKEEILKVIYELPKEKVNNPISAYSSIDMKDIENVIDKMNENKTYIDLVKENVKLQQENKELKEDKNKVWEWVIYKQQHSIEPVISTDELDDILEILGDKEKGSEE